MVRFTQQQYNTIIKSAKKAGRRAIGDEHWTGISDRRKLHLFIWYLKNELNKIPRKRSFLERLKEFFK